MDAYYIVYFWCLITSIIYYFSRKRNIEKIFYLLINLLPIAIFVGLRSEYNGRDTHMYTIIFKTIRDTDWNNLDVIPRIETMYLILNKVVSEFTSDTTTFFTFVSIITFSGIMYYIYKNSNNICLSLYLCICCLYIFEPMNTVRQMIAVSVILFFYKFLLENKYKFFSIGILIASTFHTSALLMFITFFFRTNNLKKLFFRMFICIILWVIIIQIFSPLLGMINAYAYYLQTDMINTNNIKLGFIRDCIFSIIPIMLLAYGIKSGIYNKKEEKNAYQLIVFLFFFLLVNLSTYLVSSIIMRINIFFEFFIIIAIPLSLKVFSSKMRFSLNLLIVILFALYFYVYLGMQYKSDLIQPYEMFIYG